jgi:hypothetical protein
VEVVVVVVMTALFGAGGGGAETRWDCPSEAQPAIRPIALKQAKRGERRRAARAEAERDGGEMMTFFIA